MATSTDHKKLYERYKAEAVPSEMSKVMLTEEQVTSFLDNNKH